MRIDGTVAFITGASEGIGAACVDSFRRRGARIALVARTREKLNSLAAPSDLVLAGDVTDANFREDAVKQTIATFGRIDILINSAGVGLYAPSWSAPLDDVRSMVEVNLFAALGLIQLVVPQMKQQHGGMIVNIGSIAGKVTLPWLSLYSATKYAVGSLTSGLRMELMPDHIRTMLVCPGYVQTGFQDHVLAGRPPAKIRDSKTFLISAERCAEDIARGVEKDKRTVLTPAAGWWFVLISRLLPGLVDAQLAKIYHRLERS